MKNLFKSKIKRFIFLFFLLPIFSFAASINFSEIMFDPAGSDTDKEWVEIKNSFSSSVNLEKYKFCDSGSCHKLYDGYGNNFKIPGNSFGIIAKKPEKFKSEYPNFSGFILRSSFSLSNSSEKLELKNENGSVISIVEYNSEIGGNDGDTFSLFGDTWKNGKATPGKENVFKEKTTENSDSGGGQSSSGGDTKIDRTYVEITDVIDGKKKLRAEIIDNIPTLIAGAETEFNGRAYGITGVEIGGAEYFWNFGDGEKEYGKNVKHTFLYPGEYVLSLIVKSANFTGNTRKIVKVVSSNLEISDVSSNENWIKIKNNYSDILKLDGWYIFVDGDKFKIPKETYILAHKEIIFPNKITNLDVRENSNIYLLFPNGEKVTKFIKKSEIKIEAPKKEVEVINIKLDLEEKNKITFSQKIKSFFKKPFKKEVKKENKINLNEDFLVRNFIKKEDKKEGGVKVGENFAKQNFLPDNLQKIQNLKLKSNKNFILEHKYFIFWIIFTAILLLISFGLNYFENKNLEKKEIEEYASEYEIEEI